MSSGAYTHNTRAVVPWKDLTTANDKFLAAGSLPPDTILCEPSKLQQYAVINMWNYWKRKERRDEPTIKFIHAKAEDRRHRPEITHKQAKQVEFMDISRSSSPTTGITSDIGRSLTPDHQPLVRHSPPRQSAPGPSRTRRSPTPHPGQDLDPIDDEASGTIPSKTPDPTAEADDLEEEEPSLDPDCPKAHKQTKKARIQYLKSLSDNDVYHTMLRSLERIKVFILFTS
ncbi:MAG: hypothetical protein QOE33_3666 [Acidobacteriota bacterium]|jgi:hypothetical protein|nr:hypothetical protein [Acidobacteriota bacterium]